MLALDEKQYLVQAISRLLFEEIGNAVKPLKEKIERLEKFIGDMPVPVNGKDGADGKDGAPGKDGVDGKDGAPGKDGVAAEVPWDFLNEQLSAGMEMLGKQLGDRIAELKPGKDGKDGVDGKDGIDGLPGVDGKDGQMGQPGKDGRDGSDGADGKSLSLDDVSDHIASLVSEAVAALPVPRHCTGGFVDRDGALSLTLSDGSIQNLGTVVGENGKDCDMASVARQVDDYLKTIEKPKDGKDGKDGVGFDDMEFEQVDDRSFAIKFVKGDNRKVFNFVLNYPLFKGVWREGEYERGDCVIRDGSLFIAVENTKTVPATLNSGWVLCTKKGRDGKQGEKGPQGEKGKDGKDGRDLTQLGPDGRKW